MRGADIWTDYSLTFWHVFTRWFCFIMHQGASWNLCPTFVAPHSASIFSWKPRPVAAKAASVRLIHRTFVHDAGSSVISFWNQTPRKGWTWTSHDEPPGGPAAICCNLRHHFWLKYRKADGGWIIVRRFLGCPVITWSFSGHCWGSRTWSSWKEASQTTLIGESCIPKTRTRSLFTLWIYNIREKTTWTSLSGLLGQGPTFRKSVAALVSNLDCGKQGMKKAQRSPSIPRNIHSCLTSPLGGSSSSATTYGKKTCSSLTKWWTELQRLLASRSLCGLEHL